MIWTAGVRGRLIRLPVAGLLLILMVIGVAVWWTRSRDPDRLLAQADAAFRAGDQRAAARLLDRAARVREPVGVERLLRARVELASGRADEAHRVISAVADNDPVALLALLLKGQIEVKLGRLPAAEATFRRALIAQPKFAQARRELAFIYNIQHRSAELDEQLDGLARLGELTPAYLLHWTKTKHANWDASKDREALLRFVEGDPSDRYSRLALAEANLRTGRFAEAEAVLRPLSNADEEALALRARLALDEGRIDEAERLLAPIAESSAAVALVRGDLRLLGGDVSGALAAFEVAAKADPSGRRAAAGAARALRVLGRNEDARPFEQRVARHDALGLLVAQVSSVDRARDATLRHEIARACEDLGRVAEARAWYGAAIAIDPSHAESQAALSRLAQP